MKEIKLSIRPEILVICVALLIFIVANMFCSCSGGVKEGMININEIRNKIKKVIKPDTADNPTENPSN